MQTIHADIHALPIAPSLLGESPVWWPGQDALWWTDIPGRALHRWQPATTHHAEWAFEAEVGSLAPLASGALLLALRGGLERFDPATGERRRLAAAPYDERAQRFNDGKADAQGRFWVATLCEPRQPPRAALYRWAPASQSGGGLQQVNDGLSVGNGIAWSPDGRTMYLSDTYAHTIWAHDFDADAGMPARRRVLAQFPSKPAMGAGVASLEGYGGRPDGTAVDAEGCLWVAMFEGQRLLRLSPAGEILAELPLPVRCPTMPCFGGPDLKTLYITTARDHRPAAELAAQPLAGCVLNLQVDVPGLPVNFARE